MVHHMIGDVLTREGLTHIIHQANLFHTFGSGIALQIRNKYPVAFESDRRTPHGDRNKLGTFSYAKTPDGKVIINLYSQIGIGGSDRQTDYISMKEGFKSIKRWLTFKAEPIAVGIPYKIGCGLANGDWVVVEKIINDIFRPAPFDTFVCRHPDFS